MALARLDVPARDALRRLDPARPLPGPRRHDPGGLRGRRRARRGQDDRRGAARARGRREPRRRRVRRPVHREHDGDGLRGARHLARWARRWCPRSTRRKAEVAYEAGKLVDRRPARAACRPRDIITREALENAIAAVATSGGSTNAVLHLLAVAREAGVELTIDDFDRDQRAHAAALRPQARRPLRRRRPLRGRRRAGPRQAPARARRAPRRRDHGDRQDRRRDRRRGRARRPASAWSRPLDEPLKPTGGLAILRGNLAPEGCVVKLAGHERRLHTRPRARVRRRGGGDGRRHPRRHLARATSS